MNTIDKHLLYISRMFPSISYISKPAVLGQVRNVYIVNTKTKKMVCRFSDKQNAFHNAYVSHLLSSNGITVPRVSIYSIGNTYCEIYPFIPGQTLHERILQGMPKDQQDDIYRQLFEIACKISDIRYETNFPKASSNLAQQAVKNLFTQINKNQEILLTHQDLHSKNVIITPDDKIALIDLDSISPAPFAFSIARIAADAQKYKYNPKILFDLYNERIQTKSLLDIEAQSKIYKRLIDVYDATKNNFLCKDILQMRTK